MELGVMAKSTSSDEIPHAQSKGNASRDDQEMAYFGKRQQLKVSANEGYHRQKLNIIAQLWLFVDRGICL